MDWQPRNIEKINVGHRIRPWGVASDGDKKVWIVGEEGRILFTDDGGENWAVQYRDEGQWWRGISRSDDGNIWVVGNRGRIMFSNDEGVSWRRVSSGTGNLLTSVCALGKGYVWVTGRSGTLLKITDKGDKVEAIRAGARGAYLTPKSLTTGDMTQPRQRSASGFLLYSVDALDDGKIWVAGSRGTILHSRDGGMTWTAQDSGTEHALYCIFAVNDELIYAGGSRGTLLSTSNGGRDWYMIEADEAGANAEIRALCPSVNGELWAAGWGGLVLYYDGSGSNLRTVSICPEARFEGIAPIGEDGFILIGPNCPPHRIS